MKTKYKIIEPVYLVKGKKTGYRLLMAVAHGSGFGLFSINLTHCPDFTQCRKDEWCFKFCRSKGRDKLKLNKPINLFRNQLVTPENWKPAYVKCSVSKVKEIKAWVDFLNKVLQGKANG